MAKHTPEPWTVGDKVTGNGGDLGCVVDASFDAHGKPLWFVRWQNARGGVAGGWYPATAIAKAEGEGEK